ncbi:MAG: GspE/PulE family protein [Planctomycetaceae bacterium]
MSIDRLQGGSVDNESTQQLAELLDAPVRTDLSTETPAPGFLRHFDIGFARTHGVMGFECEGQLFLAVSSRDGWRQADVVNRVLNRFAEPWVATADAITTAMNLAYTQQQSRTQDVIDSIDDADGVIDVAAFTGQEDLLATDGRAPVIRLVNHLLSDAVKAGASDIHIQPYEDRIVVRQRIDGVLSDSIEVPKAVQEEVITRIKVLGRMNIAEKRLPQDGRATVQLGDRVVDLRIASLPTSHNERIVIRLLDKSARLYTLDEVGMPSGTRETFRKLIRRDHGLILVTGPTGSGKSTTLYSALQEINSRDQNVLTIEDPIEYQLDGINQTQVNEKKGMTFATGLRSVLRQDPDIIMVGEIRDRETAVMAIQASLTGHLVFSTLHTNDAASAVTRLLDLGIEPYLVSSSLIAALAQRLVRRLCPECKTPSLDGYVVGGCDACRGSGFAGRVGIFELLVLNERSRSQVESRASAADIRQAAIADGMRMLRRDGLDKIESGVTTREEVERVASLGDADIEQL